MKLKQFEDFQLYVREKDWGFWQNSEYEPEETKLIKSLVKPDMVCLDIGANIGYYTVLMAKLGAYVYAFEPEPSNYEMLKKNVFSNDILNHYSLYDTAVGAFNGKCGLNLCDTNNGMHRMYKSKFCKDWVNVDMVEIDSIPFSHDKIDFVKIDVEGYESRVLAGMFKTMFNHKPKFLLEFHPPSIKETGVDPHAIYKWFQLRDYDIRLVPNIDQTISYEDLYKETMKEPSGRNILCLKK